MGSNFGDFGQAWTRGLIVSGILIVIGLVTRQFKRIHKRDYVWFLVISLGGGLNQAPYYYAFQKLEIGVATMLLYASLTIGGFLFGASFFKEKITRTKIIALCLSLLGMGLIYGIKLDGGWLPMSMAILAGLMGSAEVVFSKKISSHYSTLQVITSIFLVMFVSNALIALLVGENPPVLALNSAWFGQFGYILSTLAAMYTVVVGFKYLEPSVGAIIGLLEIVFAVIFGIIFLQEKLSLGIIAGGLCILLASGAPNIEEQIERKFSLK